MGLTKVPARDFTLEIDANYGGSGGEDWTPIGGLLSLTPQPATVEADTTDFDSDGVHSHFIMERGVSFAIAGQRLEDVDTGARDAGQEAVEAAQALMGIQSLTAFRLTTPGGNVTTFLASVEITPFGGGHNDVATWNATIHISGVVTEV